MGFARFTIDGLAKATSVNRTMIYRRWPSKAALLAAALSRVQICLICASPQPRPASAIAQNENGSARVQQFSANLPIKMPTSARARESA